MSAQWYAASLQSNREQQAQKYFAGQGVIHFLPTYRTLSSRKDRSKILVRPLFPGYIFVQLIIPGPKKTDVLKCPGVSGIVSFSGVAAPIDDSIIESLKILTGADSGEVQPHPLVRAGQRVLVTEGPFKGASGMLFGSSSRKKQLVVEVGFLGRAVAVPILPEQAIPLL
ncbi:MAG: hypothetical protein JXX29_09980 [Deltaproteobacteria bacterium]|nr:hypothetical protein [Deltaproteobacteria bacterium]MBN2671994.1 hypothetical protein [Deltaproteobacteria bacterium]